MLVLLLCTLLSCQEKDAYTLAEDLMGDWYKKKLNFPENLYLVNADNQSSSLESLDKLSKPYYVLHQFKADCSPCVEELVSIQDYILEHKEDTDLNYIFIGNATNEKRLKAELAEANFQFPVYFDQRFIFNKLNRFDPTDRIFKTMLINKEKELLLFGSIFDNPKAEELFISMIKK